MKKAERAALRALEAKATPGEWNAGQDFFDCADNNDWTEADKLRKSVAEQRARNSQEMVDAELLVAARNSLRSLLDQLDDAEAVIKAVHDWREHMPIPMDILAAVDAYDAKHGGK